MPQAWYLLSNHSAAVSVSFGNPDGRNPTMMKKVNAIRIKNLPGTRYATYQRRLQMREKA